MYSGFYWELLGNALIKLDPPKNWSNRAPLHIFSSRRAQSTFAKRWRIENWERNVIKFMCRINQYCPHFSTSAKDKSKKVNFQKWFGSGNYFDVLFWYSIHSQWQIVGNKKYQQIEGMYIVWNVQEAENVGILASLKISHFPFWFPILKGSIREREGNGKNPFPKFGNGKGIEKIHSRNLGTGREWKKSILTIREQEGN